MANFEIPENPNINLNIQKLEATNPAHADLFNTIFQALICNDQYLINQISNLDCGYFTDAEESVILSVHNSEPESHSNITADGGSVAIVNNTITLNEHLTDENAHPNIILDGNV